MNGYERDIKLFPSTSRTNTTTPSSTQNQFNFNSTITPTPSTSFTPTSSSTKSNTYSNSTSKSTSLSSTASSTSTLSQTQSPTKSAPITPTPSTTQSTSITPSLSFTPTSTKSATLTPISNGTEIWVDSASINCTGRCGTILCGCPSIQNALDQIDYRSKQTTIINIIPGTYTGKENTNLSFPNNIQGKIIIQPAFSSLKTKNEQPKSEESEIIIIECNKTYENGFNFPENLDNGIILIFQKI